jgi:hypothetical protein
MISRRLIWTLKASGRASPAVSASWAGERSPCFSFLPWPPCCVLAQPLPPAPGCSLVRLPGRTCLLHFMSPEALWRWPDFAKPLWNGDDSNTHLKNDWTFTKEWTDTQSVADHAAE